MNRLARFLGIMAVVCGVAFALATVWYMNNPNMAAGVFSASGSAATDAAFASVFALVIGILFLLVKPYRPDLQDSQRSKAPLSGQRFSWWTGEPK